MKELGPRLTKNIRPSTLRSERSFMAVDGKEVTPPREEYIKPEDTPERLKRAAAGRTEDTLRKWLETAPPEVREALEREMLGRDRPTEAEGARGRVPRQELEISDPILKQRMGEINEFIRGVRGGGMSKARQEEIINRILELTPPKDEKNEKGETIRAYSGRQKEAFELEKQRLLSAMASETIKASTTDLRSVETITKLTTELGQAVLSEDYDTIDEVIGKKLDNNDPTYAGIIGRIVESMQGLGKDHMLEYLLEYGVERILSMADIEPRAPYPRFNLYEETNLDGVIQTARIYDEIKGGERPTYKMFRYLASLRTKRHAMHELFRGMKSRQTYVELVTQLLRKDGMAFVEKEIVGVADVQIMYEQVLGSRLAFKEGWLTGQDFEQADKEVEDNLRYSIEENPDKYQKELKDEERVVGKRRLREWEIRRAALVGRSLGAACLRRLTYGVMGDIPKRDPQKIKSLEFEFMARILAPIKILPQRFFGQQIAQRYIERLLAQLKRGKDGKEDPHKYGYVDKDGNPRGLYGKSQDASAILDTGVPDTKSNGWRARNIFLEQKDFRITKIIDEYFTLGEFLDLTRLKIENDARKEAERAGKLTDNEWDILKSSDQHLWKERIVEKFNKEVRPVIAEQRLFLGTLMRHYELDGKNKEAIWRNVVELLPSRTAAFLPEETLEIAKRVHGVGEKEARTEWDKFKQKLWLIERARVKDDADALKEKRKDPNKPLPNKKLQDYFNLAKLNAKEVQMIEELQKLGQEHISDFAKIKFPFTAFLDDVPKTDWEELEDEDFDRLFVNDHSNFAEGYGKIVGLIAYPGAKEKDVIQHFKEAFDKIEQPLGRFGTQDFMGNHVNAYLGMGRANRAAKLVGYAMKLLGVPRSEIEEYNIKADTAQDEERQRNIIVGLAQQEVLSADKTRADKNGKTQADRLLEENDADWKGMLKMYIRLVLLLLGPVAGKEFLKIILPGDFAKQLG